MIFMSSCVEGDAKDTLPWKPALLGSSLKLSVTTSKIIQLNIQMIT